MLWVSSGKKTPPSAYKIIIIQFSISCLTDLTVKQEKLFLFSYILPKKSNRTQLGSGKDENTAFHSRFGYTKHVKMDYLVFKTYFLSRYANPVGNMSSRIPAISLIKICKSGSEYVISHSSHISYQDMQIRLGICHLAFQPYLLSRYANLVRIHSSISSRASAQFFCCGHRSISLASAPLSVSRDICARAS